MKKGTKFGRSVHDVVVVIDTVLIIITAFVKIFKYSRTQQRIIILRKFLQRASRKPDLHT